MRLFLLFILFSSCGAKHLQFQAQKSNSKTQYVNKLTIKGGELPVTKLPLPAIKLGLQFLLTGLNSLSWLLPFHYKSLSQDKLILSRGNVFAGGIFLMLSLGHLVPHSLEDFATLGFGSSTTLKLTLFGLLTMFFIEKVAFNSHELLHVTSDDNKHTHIHTQGREGKGQVLSNKSAIILLLAMSLHR